MSRIIGAFGLGIFFLLISPNLRSEFMAGVAYVSDTLAHFGILTYLGLAVVVIGGLLFVLKRAPQ